MGWESRERKWSSLYTTSLRRRAFRGMTKAGEHSELWRLKGKVWEKGVSWQESGIFQGAWGHPSCKFESTVSHLLLHSHHPYMLAVQSINAGWRNGTNPWLVEYVIIPPWLQRGVIRGGRNEDGDGKGHELPQTTAKMKERVLGWGVGT